MARTTTKKTIDENLDINTSMFYGLQLDEQQKEFRNAIWDDIHKIVFCNAKAGTGKTSLALMTARLLVSSGRYDGVTYIFPIPNGNSVNGFLPGDLQSKEMPHYQRIFSILEKMKEDPNKSIKQLAMTYIDKINGGKPNIDNVWLDCQSDTYLRGATVGEDRQVIIIDEAENFYVDQLKTVLTRLTNNCKTVVIGHNLQCDLYKNPQRSGFVPYLEHFRHKEYCKICELTKNYRGEVSRWADELTFKE